MTGRLSKYFKLIQNSWWVVWQHPQVGYWVVRRGEPYREHRCILQLRHFTLASSVVAVCLGLPTNTPENLFIFLRTFLCVLVQCGSSSNWTRNMFIHYPFCFEALPPFLFFWFQMSPMTIFWVLSSHSNIYEMHIWNKVMIHSACFILILSNHYER